MTPKLTPSQTVGPFFAFGLTPEQYSHPMTGIAGPAMADERTPGSRIRIIGQVFDGNGEAVPDAMIELWQADAAGRYPNAAGRRGSNAPFTGFGRCGTGPQNRFVFETVKPGKVDAAQAPHINVVVFMRGLLTHAYTRLYFADEATANAVDPVLQSVPAARRPTLIASRADATTYQFDICMQGADETVFFDV